MNGQQVTNSLNALSKMNLENESRKNVFEAVAERAQQVARELNVIEASSILNALGKYGHADLTLMNDLLEKLSGSTILFLKESFYLYEKPQLQYLQEQILSRLASLNTVEPDLLYVLAGYTMVPFTKDQAWITLKRLLTSQTQTINLGQLDTDMRGRLFRFCIWFGKQNVLKQELKPQVCNFVDAKQRTEGRVSSFQKKVWRSLLNMYRGNWRLEAYCDRSHYTIDITHGNLAIEVNGPFHYVWGVETMATRIKNEILRLYG
jgi:hypothetical protein